MEDNLKVNESVMDNEQKKKKKSFSVIISLIVLLCVASFGILCGTGVMPVPVGNSQFVDIDTAKLIKNASNVQDEESLRQLLLLDMELDITVTNDIKVKESFMVYGKKTLRGDATISADFFGKFEQISLFAIQKGASVTMDGLVIDGNGLADGFSIAQNAELTYLKGTLQKVHQGIVTNGTVTIEDINLHTIGKYGINALFKSDVYLNGGKIYNSGTNLIYIDSMANVEIREGCEIFASRSNLITNVGTLKVYGGSLSTSYHGIGIHNQGKLEMDYQGETEGGMITISDTAAAAIIMDSNQDGYISDVHTSNIGKNAIWVSDLKARGGVTVENCVFEGSGMAYGSASALSLGGTATVKDVVIKDSTDDGIYLRKDSQFVLENISVENTNGMGIYVCGSKLDAKNITIKGAAFGVSLQKDGNFVADANIEGITVSEARRNNIQLYEGTKIRLKDAVLEKSIRTSVYIAKDTEAELDNVEIKGVTDPGLLCFAIREGAKATILGDTVITGATLRGIGMYQDSSLTMKSGVIKDITSSGSGAAILLEKGATFNMLGGTFTNNYSTASGGAVYVSHGATFNMKGGTISNNQSEKNGGGAVQLQGVMNFSGGTIKNNISGQYGAGINVAHNKTAKTNGKLNMTGGTISGNKATTVGGGILIASTSEANISGGTISNNSAKGLDYLYGNGIYLEGKLTLSDKAYLGKDVITLATSSVVLDIKGNTLSKHNANNPLLVGAARGTKEGIVVVKGDSEQAINSLLSHVASGSKAYTLCQNEKDTKTMTVSINQADMDMTGADKVYVNSFKELKEAVETTTSKRYIIIGADIQFESNIVIPDGTTVYIRDDGQPRVFSRAEGYTSSYFTAYYGTGFYLVGTAYGNLKLDGTISGDAKAEKVSAFTDARGTTEIRNIAFENNKSLRPGKCGSFIYQEYGDTSIYSSTFTGGVASYGGAIYLGGGNLTLDDCIFKQNEAIEKGGALFVAAGNAKVLDTAYVNNSSKSGGAVYLDGGETSFVRQTNSNSIFSGNIATGTALSGTNCKDGGGAIYVQRGKVTSIEGYTFEENKGQDGGAIVANKYSDSKSGVIESLKNCYFYKNQAIKSTDGGGRGGAIYHRGSTTVTLKIENCTFGGTDKNGSLGNIAESYGGAVWANRPFEITGEGLFENNESSIAGGAVYMTDPYKYTISNQIFKNNQSVNGGALYTNNANSDVVLKDTKFVSNKTTENGGAIYSKGKLDVNNTVFENSTAKAGGAVYVAGGITSFKENTKFVSNTTTGNGGAIATYGELKVEDTSFINNASTSLTDTYGGAIYIAKGNVSKLEKCTFTGNTAPNGGAIGANNTGYTAKVTNGITNSKFNENVATNYRGGAIYYAAYESEAGLNEFVIDNCEFSRNEVKGNSGTPAGGAIWTNRTMEIKGNGVFEENSASDLGGAIYVTNGNTYNITSQTFKNNSAKDGGALYTNNANANVILKDTKFVSNKTTENGGAIYSKGKLEVNDTVFEKSTAKAGGAVYIDGGTASFKGTGASESAIFSSNIASGTEVDKSNNCVDGGGAIYVQRGKVTSIEGYTFEENKGQDGGAIVANKYSDSASGIIESLKNCNFYKNQAIKSNNDKGGRGGAIYHRGSTSVTLEIENCTFGGSDENGSLGNIAESYGGAIWANRPFEIKGEGLFENNESSTAGGAVYMTDSYTYTISNQIFKNNQSVNGGALYTNNANSDVVLKDTKFVSNKTTENGGAIYSKGKLDVNDTTFNNSTSKDGGAVYIYSGTASFKGTENSETAIFSDNTATGIGGAICIASSGKVSTIEGYTFSGNKAVDGGAIEIVGGSVQITESITNCNFIENTASNRGGAIRSNGAEKKLLLVKECEFVGNTGKTGGAIWTNRQLEISGDGLFKNNSATNTDAAVNGGAVYVAGGTNVKTVTIAGQTFENNSSVNVGSAVCSYNGDGAIITITDSNFISANGAKSPVYTRGTTELSNVTFSGGNKEIELPEEASRAILSGKITGAVFVYKNADALVKVASTGIDEASTISLTPKDYTVGAQVLGSEDDSATAKEALANAAKIINVTQDATPSGANWWKITSEGKLDLYAIVNSASSDADYGNLATAINEAPAGAVIYVNANETIANTITIDKVITLKTSTAGVTLTRGNTAEMFNVKSSGSLIVEGAITLDGNKANINGTNSLIVNNGTLSMGQNVTIQNAKSSTSGGAITTYGELVLKDTSFINNESTLSDGFGGAIYLYEGNISSLEGCTFTGNTANNGGAIGAPNKGASAKITNGIKNSKFYDNKATHYRGGAIYYAVNNTSNKLVIDSCEFIGNEVIKKSDKNATGGAIWINRPMEIKGNGVFENNSSSNYGGAIYATDPYAYSITGQTFKNNSAVNGGSAICHYYNGDPEYIMTISDSNFITADGAISPVYTRRTIALSNATFNGANKEVNLPTSKSKAIISGNITGAVFVYNNASALVQVASTGIDEASTISLTPNSYTVGTQVLGSEDDSATAKEALANAAKIINVTQDVTPSGANWWKITSEGKLDCSAIVSDESAVTDFTSLVDAISEAPTGAVIYVNKNENITDKITISKAVTLKTSTAGVTLTRGNKAEMFNVTNSGSLTVEGAITLDGNNVSGSNSLIVNNGTLSMRQNVTIQNAKSSTSGGAITTYGELLLEGTSFTNNASTALADTYGGAIYIANGNVSKLEKCTFTGNTAPNGGAIGAPNKGATAKITNGIKNSKFYDNKATNYRGGAIYYAVNNTSNTLVIDSCEFIGNEVTKTGSSNATGGAIWTNRPMDIKGNGVFENNSSSNYGGAIYATDKYTYNITSQTFKNNTANYAGGAICFFNSNATGIIDDSHFNGNVARVGGAIHNAAKVTIYTYTNSTFTDNKSNPISGDPSDNVTSDGTTIAGLYNTGTFTFKTESKPTE